MQNRLEPKFDVAAFMAAGVELDGILTLPLEEGPHPAIAFLHGSDRSGKEDPYNKEQADNLVESGFAILRYDGPGWGSRSAQNLNKFYIIKYCF